MCRPVSASGKATGACRASTGTGAAIFSGVAGAATDGAAALGDTAGCGFDLARPDDLADDAAAAFAEAVFFDVVLLGVNAGAGSGIAIGGGGGGGGGCKSCSASRLTSTLGSAGDTRRASDGTGYSAHTKKQALLSSNACIGRRNISVQKAIIL